MTGTSKRSRLRLFVLSVAITTALLGTAVIVAGDRTPRLIEKAHAVMPFSIGDQQCVSFTWSTSTQATMVLRSTSLAGKFTFGVAQLNTSSRSISKMSGLEKALEPYDTLIPFISPYGDKALFIHGLDPEGIAIDLLDLQGRRLHRWRNALPDFKPEFVNSAGDWLEIEENLDTSKVVQHNIAAPDQQKGSVTNDGIRIGVDHTGRVASWFEEDGAKKHDYVTLQSISGGSNLKYSLPIPLKAMPIQVEMSPATNRLLILMLSGGGQRFPASVTRLLPFLKRYLTPQRVTLMTCTIDGKNMHTIGSAPLARQLVNAPVNWLPDGKTISFVHDSQLWFVEDK